MARPRLGDYLVGVEGLALLRHWLGGDPAAAQERIAEQKLPRFRGVLGEGHSRIGTDPRLHAELPIFRGRRVAGELRKDWARAITQVRIACDLRNAVAGRDLAWLRRAIQQEPWEGPLAKKLQSDTETVRGWLGLTKKEH